MSEFRILALSGSLRVASLNTAMLNMATLCLPPGLHMSVHATLGDLPLFNPDLESHAPSAVEQLQGCIAAADALLIASPEYAHGVSSVMKNALDWMVGITTQLQAFAAQYNDWITQFGSTTASGGVLAGTQAAEASLSELDQSVENRFNGAADGIHGMSDLGLTIDPSTKLASLDTSKLDAVLTSNKTGVIDTIQQFSTNFTKSAELLNSTNNFIPNQLNNLDSAIQYITNNESALQS